MGLTPLLIEFARRKKIHDKPNARSIHSDAIPRLGGVSIFVATIMLIIPVMLLQNIIGDTFRGLGIKVIVILIASSIMFVTGLLDDIKGIRIRTKFACQIFAAVLVCSFGVRFHCVGVQVVFTVNFGWFGFVLTILWIVGITNAVNFIDGLDGLAGGICAISCFVMAIVSIFQGNVVLAVLMLALLGSLMGFLLFNFNPAKIFMGDCGSLFLGFIIASSTVLTGGKSTALVGVAMPLLVLGIPIFDAFFCMLRRFLNRTAMTSADRGHFHHRLLDLGFAQHHIAIIAYVVTLLMAGLGFLLMAARGAASIIIFLSGLVLLLLLFRIIGSVRLRETLASFGQRSEFEKLSRLDQKAFEQAQLHFNNARDFNDWWNCLCRAAEDLDFSSMTLPLSITDDKPRNLSWQRPQQHNHPETLKMKIPIREIKAGPIHSLEANVNINGSLESAGRRTALFSRLLDQNKIFDLPNKKIPNS